MINEPSRRDESSRAPVIELPQAGVLSGYGETFRATSYNGTADFTIPLQTPTARSNALNLQLGYVSGGGNGPFGLGFSLHLPGIARRTDKGIPRYNGDDRFLFGGAELVVAYTQEDEHWIPDERAETRDEVRYRVTRYCPRIESAFTRIERWAAVDGAQGTVFWQSIDRDNTITYFGRTSESRIADPTLPERIFEWLPDEICDAHGNRTIFYYKPEDDALLPRTIYNEGRDYRANRYLAWIRFGNFSTALDEAFAFEIIFDYGEYEFDPVNLQPVRPWAAREDCFSTFRAGFEVRTNRLCQNILVVHHFAELGAPRLVSRTSLTYALPSTDPTIKQSMLCTVQRLGYQFRDGSYVTQAMPSIDLDYTKWHPQRLRSGELTIQGEAIQAQLGSGTLRLIDLFADGLPGILYTEQETYMYARPEGEGAYSAWELLPLMPEEADGENTYLTDLDGSGHIDMLVASTTSGGFYKHDDHGGWSEFRAFPAYTSAFVDPVVETTDVSGKGLGDLWLADGTTICYWLSLGTEGFAPGVSVPQPPGFPSSQADSVDVLTGFARIFGDGLSHRVRVMDGEVVVWPSLGYGRYGPPISMANAPRFPAGLTTARLFFVDILGSGCADLVFACQNYLEIYLNELGNAFSSPMRIEIPAGITDQDALIFADILGTGTVALVISGSRGTPTRYIDLAGGEQPSLLNRITNNMGMQTEIEYRSSTAYALRDTRNGKPWATRLPFPVQVVSSVRTRDHVQRLDSARVFQYRDGYFDPVEQVFRGFGFIQTQDTETLSPALWHFPSAGSEGSTRAPTLQPALVRSWQLTGAYLEGTAIERQYEQEYFQADPLALSLPLSLPERTIMGMHSDIIREAYAALSGSKIRQETWGLNAQDEPGKAPYTIAQSSFTVFLLQPSFAGQPAVFYVAERETATSVYEQEVADPRITHTLNLDIDDFGNITRSALISYPRRTRPGPPPLPGQATITATLTEAAYANHPGPDFYIVGKQYRDELYELSGLSTGSSLYFTFATLAAQAATAIAHALPFGTPFTPDTLQARLTTATRQYYWNEDETQRLPLGTITGRSLLYYAPQAAFNAQFMQAVFNLDRDAVESLAQASGYVLLDGYWWEPGIIYFYASSAHDVITEATDPFGASIHYTWDAYALNLVSSQDALGQVSTAIIDYQTLMPRAIVDVNENISEVLYGPLANAVVTSTHGVKDGKWTGNMDLANYTWQPTPSRQELLQNPDAYLQGASMFLLYDFDAWKRAAQPASIVLVGREWWYNQASGHSRHDVGGSPLAPETPSPYRILIRYLDGNIRDLCEKTRVEREVTSDPPAGESAGFLWVTANQVTCDERGNAWRRYLPYFTASPDYDWTPTAPFVTSEFDALQRVVRLDLPRGYFRRTVFAAWEQTDYDENDTLHASRALREHSAKQDQKSAGYSRMLDATLSLSDTPTITSLDTRGLTIATTRTNIFEQNGTTVSQVLTEYTWLDISGNLVAAADARFFDREHPNEPAHYSLQASWDMLSREVSAWSADAGTRLLWSDALDEPFQEWDARGFSIAFGRDVLRRLISMKVIGNGLDQFTELLAYGDDPTTNTRNHLIEHHDQAGILRIPAYDILGNPIVLERQFVEDGFTQVNWNDPLTVHMLNEKWPIRREYNSLSDLVREVNPDQSEALTSYFANGWERQVEFTAEGHTTVVVPAMQYNAAGMCTTLDYGNGSRSRYYYNPETFYLDRTTLARSGDASILQDLRYIYDPVGNLMSVSDEAQRTTYWSQQAVAPTRTYTYDSLYQLRTATGRQQPTFSSTSCGTVMPFSLPTAPPTASEIQTFNEIYEYDRSGNRTVLRHQSGTPDQWYTQEVVVSDTSNHAIPRDEIGTKNPDDFYDPNGNLISLANLREIHYDYRNLLWRTVIVQRDQAAPDENTCQYDAAQQRVRKAATRLVNGGAVTNTEQTFYIGNLVVTRTYQTSEAGTRVVRETDSISVLVHGQRVLCIDTTTAAQNSQTVYRYQVAELSPSVVFELDANAQVISYEEFFPYGGTAILEGPVPVEVERKRYRYSGKELDTATGLYYYGDRYFVPCMGRWMTPDPSGPNDGMNLYRFVRNNPVSYLDNDGNVTVTVLSWNINKTNKNAVEKADALAGIMNTQPIDLVVLQEVSSNTATWESELTKNLDESWSFVFAGSKPSGGTIGKHTYTPQGTQDHYAIIFKDSTVKDVKVIGFPTYASDANINTRYNATHFSNQQTFANRLGLRRPLQLEVTMQSGEVFTLYNWHAPEGGGGKMDAIPAIDIFGSSTHLEDQIANNDEIVAVADWNATIQNVKSNLGSFKPASSVSAGKWDHAVSTNALKKRKFSVDDENDIKRVKSDHPPLLFDATIT